MKVSIIGVFLKEPLGKYPTHQSTTRVGLLDVVDLEEDLSAKLRTWVGIQRNDLKNHAEDFFLGNISHQVLPESTES
jgi:hypothetical protein